MHHVHRDPLAFQHAVDEHAHAAVAPGQDQGVAGQFAERDGAFSRERMTDRDERGHPIRPEVLIRQLPVDPGVTADPEIHLAGFHRVRDASPDQLHDPDRNARVIVGQLTDRTGQDAGGDGGQRRDGDDAALVRRELLAGDANRLDVGEHALDRPNQLAAHLRQRDMAPVPIEELHAERVFELFDLDGQGGLADVQLFGRARKAPAARDLEEGFHVAKLGARHRWLMLWPRQVIVNILISYHSDKD